MKLYWSCSKFADWLRGTSKPFSGTSEEWDAWENEAKKKKFRYWLAEEGLGSLEKLICWPPNRINDVRFYINNRWVIKSHALTSHLKRGQWYDFDTRLLNAVFDELVNFIEIEAAWMLVICSKEDHKKYKVPGYRTIFRIGTWRCPEAGIAYLQWAADLKIDEDWVTKDNPRYGQPTSQALAAQETLKLYKWWKEERPKRPDPSEASGWSQYCKENRRTGQSSHDKQDDQLRSMLDLYHKIEKEHEDEDTEMLIRLVKIRQNLWT